jgi:hypothetical protein
MTLFISFVIEVFIIGYVFSVGKSWPPHIVTEIITLQISHKYPEYLFSIYCIIFIPIFSTLHCVIPHPNAPQKSPVLVEKPI